MHWGLKEATRQGMQRMETNIEEHYEDLRNDNKRLDKRIDMLGNDVIERMNVMSSNLMGQMEARISTPSIVKFFTKPRASSTRTS